MTAVSLDDLVELAATLNRHGVEYVLIGGAAANLYGYPRRTQDLDVLARGGLENLARLGRALTELGATHNRQAVDHDDLKGFNTRWRTRVGQVDVLLAAAGPDGTETTYRQVSGRIASAELRGIEVPVIGIADLLDLKHAAGRPHDLAAIRRLRSLYPKLDWVPPSAPPRRARRVQPHSGPNGTTDRNDNGSGS